MGEFMPFLCPVEVFFEKTSVYTHTEEGKSRLDWLVNNANRHDKNGALKSMFNKHEPESQEDRLWYKGVFPSPLFSFFFFFCWSVGGQPPSWVWSVARRWFREGLGVLAVILWKQTNLSNQSHCLEEVKVPFHLSYQPCAASEEEFQL